jgi:putative pyruvate formate lyase activating enzyme
MICNACPRRCGAERTEHLPGGVCACPSLPLVARAAPHYGEEPCISGEHGSGTVFFSGCNLKCVFCQNYEISRGKAGRAVSVERLSDIFLELRDKGVHNINLVTPTHYTDAIVKALERAKLDIPVAWNSSGYDSVESLKKLEGLVQIYMPDFKYMDSALAARYSAAPDYPETAKAAIYEMFRQVGPFELDKEDMLRSGVLIRHLILPGAEANSRAVIDFVADNFSDDDILFSLMAQYTPMPNTERFPELQKTVTAGVNDALVEYMTERGICNGFWQEPCSATDDMIPDFDLTGI